jgi:hypothetical protein
MNKLLIGGAAGVLLIAGQAIAARLPDMVAARAAEPAVPVAVTAAPALAPTARRAAPVVVAAELALSPVADRLDPVAADPAGVAGVGPLSEAETARLAVRQGYQSSVDAYSAKFCISTSECEGDEVGGQPNRIPVVATVIIATTALVVATDDDSDS